MPQHNQHIIVLGAGYAGLMAALRLATKTNADITIINATDTFNERVRNHQLAARQRIGEHPLADLLRGTRIRFLQGTVTALHLAQRRITVQTETGQRDGGYDYLVYALGSHVRTADVPGVRDHAYTLDYRSVIALAERLPEVAERVADGNILRPRSVREFLSAGVMEDFALLPSVSGTPQGGVISPLLANIVLNVLDQRLTLAGYRFVRYADDFVVLCQSRAQAEQALVFVDTTLRQELGLSLSPTKTKATNFVKGFDSRSVGFHLTRRKASVRPKSIEKLKDRIREITTRCHNLDQTTIQKLNRVLIGFAHYFALPFATLRTQFVELDCWIRLRVRAMKFKRINRGDNRRWLTRCLTRMGLVSLVAQLA